VAIQGCFPGPLPADETNISQASAGDADTSAETSDATATADVELVDSPETVTECTNDSDCDDLDDACHDGHCNSGGACTTTALTGRSCDDSNPCTQDDVCSSGTCTGQPYTCDDGLVCTDEACDGQGGCVPTLKADACFVDGMCRQQGERDPLRQCFACASGSSWTPASDLACDDGDPCSISDTCSAGTCTPGRAPDDAAAGDWLSFPATFPSPDQSQQVFDVKADRTGVLVLGQFVGSATFADGTFIGQPESTWYLAHYTDTGSMSWVVDVPGGADVALLGLDVAGRAALTISCLDCSLELSDGSDWRVPTTTERPAAVVFIGDGIHASGFSVSQAPIAIDALSRTIGVLAVTADSYEVTGGDGNVVGFNLHAEREFGVVRYSASGVAESLFEAWIEDADVDGDSPVALGCNALTTKADGSIAMLIDSTHPFSVARVGFPAANYGSTMTSTTLVQETAIGFIGQAILAGQDLFIPGALFRPTRLLRSWNGWVVGAIFKGTDVVVGANDAAVSHHSTQTYSLVGPIIGAGGEAFIARFDDTLNLQWVRFIEPAAASPTGLRGTTLNNAVLDGDELLVSVRLSQSTIVGAHNLNAAALLRIAGDGAYVWSAEAPHEILGVAPLPDGHSFVLGGFAGGLPTDVGAGVGATAVTVEPDPNGGRGHLTGWVQRVNSEGQFACDAR